MDNDTAALFLGLTGKLCDRLDDISEGLTAMNGHLEQLLEAMQAQTEQLALIQRAMPHKW